MKVLYRIKLDDKDITEKIRSRLISINLKDRLGFKSDSLEIALSDIAPKIELPKSGSKLHLALGYENELIDMGSFILDEISLSSPPDTLRLRFNAASFLKGIKVKKERSWHNTTLGNIIGIISKQHGLTPAISNDLSIKTISHIDQTESDMNFLTRLSEDVGAIFKIQDENLIFINNLEGKSKSGLLLSNTAPEKIISYSYSWGARTDYTGVAAYWYDKDLAQKKKIIAGKNDNVYEISFLLKDESEAREAAEVSLRKIHRKKETLNISISFNPTITGGATLDFKIRETIPQNWLITSVTHQLTPDNFITNLECETVGEKS